MATLQYLRRNYVIKARCMYKNVTKKITNFYMSIIIKKNTIFPFLFKNSILLPTRFSEQ